MGDSVQKNRREIWSQEALSTLRKAVEAQPGGDSDMDWAEVAQKLGFTVDRVRRKWSRIKNTGAVSEPLFAQLPFAQLPLSYGTNPRNPKVDNSDLVAFFNMNLQDPRPTSAELERFVINGVRSLEQVHCALPVDAADTTATHSLTGALLLARRYNSGLEARDAGPKRIN